MFNPNCLIDATEEAVQAVSVGDIGALETALAARQATLAHATESERLVALKEGETIRMLLGGFKRRLRDQLQRLDLIKNGLARTSAPLTSKIDLVG